MAELLGRASWGADFSTGLVLDVISTRAVLRRNLVSAEVLGRWGALPTDFLERIERIMGFVLLVVGIL